MYQRAKLKECDVRLLGLEMIAMLFEEGRSATPDSTCTRLDLAHSSKCPPSLASLEEPRLPARWSRAKLVVVSRD